MNVTIKDQRQIEILARYQPRGKKNPMKPMALLGFLIVLVGGYFFMMRGIFYAIGLMGLGLVILGFSAFFNDKRERKIQKVFIDYCNEKGEPPPWPEDKLK